MKVSEKSVQIDGHTLHQTIFDPIESRPKMVCIFTHGQGDFSQRYEDVLHPFTEKGIRCISVDLLGHGKSPGKRGHCGDVAFIDQLIQSNLDLTEGLPYGIAGHSMGGLLTLRHLTVALEGKYPKPEFCWINSPLLRPANGKADWFVKVAKFLSKRAPKVTIKTGATPELCQTREAGVKRRGDKLKGELGHQRVSLGWGVELMNISDYIYQQLPQYQSAIPFLFTQGDADLICPHSVAEDFFNQLKLTNKSYHLYKDMRHETFAEPNNEELFSTIADWLNSNNIPSA